MRCPRGHGGVCEDNEMHSRAREACEGNDMHWGARGRRVKTMRCTGGHGGGATCSLAFTPSLMFSTFSVALLRTLTGTPEPPPRARMPLPCHAPVRPLARLRTRICLRALHPLTPMLAHAHSCARVPTQKKENPRASCASALCADASVAASVLVDVAFVVERPVVVVVVAVHGRRRGLRKRPRSVAAGSPLGCSRT